MQASAKLESKDPKDAMHLLAALAPITDKDTDWNEIVAPCALISDQVFLFLSRSRSLVD